MLAQSTLQTERLTLRLLASGDASSIQTVASVREIADTMISIPHPYPDGEARQYVDRQMAELAAGRSVTFVIERKGDPTLSGIVEVRDIEREHSQAELSFWLAVEAWGQGYMSEALKPILQFGFETLELNRLYAYHMMRNPGSGKVLQRNGFVQEGGLRQRVRKWGKFEDVALWAILRSDWNDAATRR
ncbi:GNAT family N-acetyltransferase [Phormidesmis sp. 146-33]